MPPPVCASCWEVFLIIYGDPGLGSHNLGRLPAGAAKTHEREVKANSFPRVPKFDPEKHKVYTVHATDATAFVSKISSAAHPIRYLAYFGHSWGDNAIQTTNDEGEVETVGGPWGLLLIGEENAASTNLGTRRLTDGTTFANDLPATAIPKDKFTSNAQIRLFGCRGGYGSNSVAKQIADHTDRGVYAYASHGGSLFTNDRTLGHGERNYRESDRTATPTDASDVWLVPFGGSSKFSRY